MSILRKIVEKKKSEKYAWPKDWMTREQAANDLGVAPRDVDDTLREAIRDGDVLKQFFPVWDAQQGRVVRHPGYRVAGPKDEVANGGVSKSRSGATGGSKGGKPVDLEWGRIERALQRDPKQDNYRIARNCRSTVGRVKEVRASLGL